MIDDFEQSSTRKVALRKESVDRNYIIKITGAAPAASLSARRAWIEIIFQLVIVKYLHLVALRKESVDRNNKAAIRLIATAMSLSARRAWIEIAMTSQISVSTVGRSPQGERG